MEKFYTARRLLSRSHSSFPPSHPPSSLKDAEIIDPRACKWGRVGDLEGEQTQRLQS